VLKAKTFNDLITQKEIDLILTFAKSKTDWEDAGGNGFWDSRTLNAVNVYKENKEVGKLLYEVRNKIKHIIINNFTNGLEVFPDLFQIVRWFPGQEQIPHADNMKNAGDGLEWYNHRDFGAVLYLNNNYVGGHTYYPQHNFSIMPKPGMLAVHPGDTNHLHGVTKIENDVRYTLASFWTYDKEYFDGWTIP
jgi:hypothetical protein